VGKCAKTSAAWDIPSSSAPHQAPSLPGSRASLSVFIALSEVTSDSGPTNLYPMTHDFAFHHMTWLSPKSAEPPILGSRECVLAAPLAPGDALVMDSRLWHCGGGNTSEKRRSLMVVSFVSAHGSRPKGSTYSLLDGLEGVRLSELSSLEVGQSGHGASATRHELTERATVARAAAAAASAQASEAAAVSGEAQEQAQTGAGETLADVDVAAVGAPQLISMSSEMSELSLVNSTAPASAGGESAAPEEEASSSGEPLSTDRVSPREEAVEAPTVAGVALVEAALPYPAAVQLFQLAETLPADDLVVKKCLDELRSALQGSAEQQAGRVMVSPALLRQLGAFRLLGPHLRASSRWGQMQQAVDRVLASA